MTRLIRRKFKALLAGTARVVTRPQDEHVADIRAFLRLVKTVAAYEPATH